MSLVDRFLKQLQARELRVAGPRDGEPDDALRLVGKTANVTDELRKALAAFRPELVKRFGRKSHSPPTVEDQPVEVTTPPARSEWLACGKCGAAYSIAERREVALLCETSGCPLRSVT